MSIKKPVILITTPIYYCNSELHLGHLYSTFYADFLSRFYKNENYNVYFLTGVDQHGQKIFKKAKENNLDTKEFVDFQTNKIIDLWKKANVNYTHFVKTTDLKHKEFVLNLFQKLLFKNEVVLKNYSGKYCISCENFVFEKTLDNKCLICKNELIDLSEKNYFLSIKKEELNEVKKILQEYKNKNKNIKFLNQLDEYLKKGEINFSISRSKVNWGIKLNEKENQTAYVWFDALLSYVSPFNVQEINEIWKSKDSKIIQILGKEIIKFHLIFWPILLKKQGFKYPDNFLVHGWILNKNTKMSKSIGNVLSANVFLEKYGSDVARLYLAKLMNPQLDVEFEMNLFDEFYNSHIVKNLSNFHFRLLSMIKKYQINFFNIKNIKKTYQKILLQEEENIKKFIDNFKNNFKNFKIAKSFNELFHLLDYGNKKINLEEPWVLYKQDKIKKLNVVIYILLVILKVVSDFLVSFAPNISNKIKNDLNFIKNINNIYEIELEFFDNFQVKLIKHLYDKRI